VGRTNPVMRSAFCTETEWGIDARAFAGILASKGKGRFRSGCVVADAVVVEPVSAFKFPANRERTGIF
jgi:hypothetical protein